MKKIIFAIVYSLFTVILGMGVPMMIGLLLFGLQGMNENMVIATNMSMGIVGTAIILTMTKYYYRKNAEESMHEFHFFGKDWGKSLVFSLVVILCIFTVYLVSIVSLGGNVKVGSSIDLLNIISGILTFLGMATLEECIFRGILRVAFAKYGLLASAIIPSALFVTAHTDMWVNFNLTYGIQIFLIGIIFFFILMMTQNMMAVIIGHAVYNILESVIFGVGTTSGLLETTFGQSGEAIISVIFIIIQMVVICVLTWLYKKSKSSILR